MATLRVFSVNESYLVGTTHIFYSSSSGFLCGGSANYYELTQYLKSADSGGTNSNLELLPDPNEESGESAWAVVVAAANKEVVAVLSGLLLFTCFTSTNHEIITLLTLLLYCISNYFTCTSKEIVK